MGGIKAATILVKASPADEPRILCGRCVGNLDTHDYRSNAVDQKYRTSGELVALTR
ncbi:hypothetical protein O9993_00705 [Vibrio lentus]|nr:hypothetical protein [Vibrio lentus]